MLKSKPLEIAFGILVAALVGAVVTLIAFWIWGESAKQPYTGLIAGVAGGISCILFLRRSRWNSSR